VEEKRTEKAGLPLSFEPDGPKKDRADDGGDESTCKYPQQCFSTAGSSVIKYPASYPADEG